MKNSTLLYRTLFLIILIAGSAHLVTYASHNNTEKSDASTKKPATTVENTISTEEKSNTIKEEVLEVETNVIEGKWKVSYDSSELNGSIIYAIKKEANVFNAYTHTYEDENGYTQKAEGTKTLAITSFDGKKGVGNYSVQFEGESYTIACKIELLDDNTFTLSYDYYGYSDVETWKKVQL